MVNEKPTNDNGNAIAEKPKAIDRTVTTLSEMAKRINEHHHACEAALNTGLHHAIEAGMLLIEAKTKCEHGGWGQWLKDHFDGSTRTAQLYARVATHRDKVEEMRNGVACLSFRQAVKSLAEPKADGNLPALSPDTKYTAAGLDDDLVEITPSATHPGYHYVAHYRNLDSEDSEVVCSKRPMRLTKALMASVSTSFDHSTACDLLAGSDFRRATDWAELPCEPAEPWYVAT